MVHGTARLGSTLSSMVGGLGVAVASMRRTRRLREPRTPERGPIAGPISTARNDRAGSEGTPCERFGCVRPGRGCPPWQRKRRTERPAASIDWVTTHEARPRIQDFLGRPSVPGRVTTMLHTTKSEMAGRPTSEELRRSVRRASTQVGAVDYQPRYPQLRATPVLGAHRVDDIQGQPNGNRTLGRALPWSGTTRVAAGPGRWVHPSSEVDRTDTPMRPGRTFQPTELR